MSISSLKSALAALLLTFTVVPASRASDAELFRLMNNYWDWYSNSQSLSVAFFGSDVHPDQLDDLSDAAFDARLGRMTDVLAELYEFDMESLSEDGRVNHATFTWMLEKERKTLASMQRYLSITTMGGWHTGFPAMIAAMPRASLADYQHLLARFQAFEAYAEQNIALLDRAIENGYTQPCETLEGYEVSILGYLADSAEESVFYAPFVNMPAELSAEQVRVLREEAVARIDTIVLPAYRRFAKFWEQDYLPACRPEVALSSVPGGRELYDHLLSFFTSLDTDAETVHALGLSEMARIRADMQAVIDEVGFEGDFKAFLAFLRSDPRFYASSEEAYLNRIGWITKSIDGILPRYFAKLPSMPYGLSVIPAQEAPNTTTAYYQPGAIDGTRAGQYFINTYKLEERPLYELPALSLHEAVPGHHLQLAFQAENPNLPDWRRVYYFHAFGEGWGLYAELLGEEMGMYKTPYERFGRMVYEAWRAARLVVDTGMHAKGWTRQQAIDYMLDNTGLAEANVIAEVNRYITYPAQATAYKHGELKIRELRKRAEDSLGDRFDLREFHVEVIEDGSMPLVVLEEKIDRWIAARQ